MGIKEELTQEEIDEFFNKPLQWVSYSIGFAGKPSVQHLLREGGLDAFARFWLLVEFTGSTESHVIPKPNERGYKQLCLGLMFGNNTELEEYLSLLADLELIYSDDNEQRRIPIVENAALKYARHCAAGKKGGKKAASNSRQSNGQGVSRD